MHIVSAQGDLPAVQRLEGPIDFDGKPDETAWQTVTPLPLISHWPEFDTLPNVKTIYRIAFDHDHLWFSAICKDDPALIQGPFFERDKWEMSQDQVALILDTYNDNENGNIFIVTPTGSRIDVSMKNDGQGDEPTDESWNSYWDAKVHHNAEGWMLEARIPFSSLRFQSVNDVITMGVIAYRYVSRERQLDIYPVIPPDWGFWSFVKVSRAQDMKIEGVRNRRPWFISPYVLAGLGYHHEAVNGNPQKEKDDQITAGLDVQHAITDNLNMDLTLNTDFAQVEADDQVVNLSRFSLFFPEKRRFFLERSSIMEFDFEDNNRLFYSRRIGLADGQIVPLWGGARFVGRVQNYDVGFMAMQSRSTDELDSENYGVFRLRRKISQSNSYVGGILTSRTDFEGHTNLTYGVDGILHMFGNDYLKVNLARSTDSGDENNYTGFLDDRKRIHVLWEKRARVGFHYGCRYSQADGNYNPGLGFEARKKFRAIEERVSYAWFPKSSFIRYVNIDLSGATVFPDHFKRVESYGIEPAIRIEGVKDNAFMMTLSLTGDQPAEPFHLADNITIQPARYQNKEIHLYYQTPSVNFLFSEFGISTGKFYEGNRFTSFVSPTFVLSRYVTLGGHYEYNHIGFDDKPDYLAHVGRLKITGCLNVKVSINAFVQYNSLSKTSLINFRLRYNPVDGNDLYIVYNEILNDSGGLQPLADARGVLVKYVRTFR